MCDSQHPDRLSPDDEWEVEGKGFQIDAALIGTTDSIRLGMLAQAPDRALGLNAESPPQTWLSFLVVADGIQKLLLGLPHKPDRHCARSLLAAVMTSSKGIPLSRP
jgi:hypothetical protein